MKTKYIIFDLDDTLMYEIDYLKSAYKEIAGTLDREKKTELFHLMYCRYKNSENVFDFLVEKYSNISVDYLLDSYRSHIPKININEGVMEIFKLCKSRGYKLGLISDGRSITQRNKLRALEIEDYFDKIIISEELGSSKPHIDNFTIFLEKETQEYFYIGDNTSKDFITPNELGWTTICLLNNGKNIHPQNFNQKKEYLPKLKINTILELKKYI